MTTFTPDADKRSRSFSRQENARSFVAGEITQRAEGPTLTRGSSPFKLDVAFRTGGVRRRDLPGQEFATPLPCPAQSSRVGGLGRGKGETRRADDGVTARREERLVGRHILFRIKSADLRRTKAADVEGELLTRKGAGRGLKGADFEVAKQALLDIFDRWLKK